MGQLFISLILGLIISSDLRSEEMKLINVATYGFSDYLKKSIFGGISGLTYDQKKNKIYAVSDDRDEYGKARYYIFDLIQNKNGTWDIKLIDKVETLNPEGKSYQKSDTDYEAIALMPDGNFLISSEGGLDQVPPIYPSFLLYSPEGKWLKNLSIPDAIKGDEKRTYGAYYNRAVESLSFTEDKKYLFFGTEYSLIQDGPRPTSKEGGYIRIYRSELDDKGDLKLGATYVYHLDPVPPVKGLKKSQRRGDNGMTEIFALNKEEFLTLERSSYEDIMENTIKIFKASTAQATDVKELKTLKKAKFTSIKKELIFDLDSVMGNIPKTLHSFNKMEGMTLGPKLSDGSRLVIMASDNDFVYGRDTLFIFLKYTGSGI